MHKDRGRRGYFDKYSWLARYIFVIHKCRGRYFLSVTDQRFSKPPDKINKLTAKKNDNNTSEDIRETTYQNI